MALLPLAGAAIGAVGSIAGGLIGNRGAKKAAEAQAAAAQQAMNFQRQAESRARQDRQRGVRKVRDLLGESQTQQLSTLDEGLTGFQDVAGTGVETAQGQLGQGIRDFQGGIEDLRGDVAGVYDQSGQAITSGFQGAQGFGQDVLNQQLGLAGGLQGVSGGQYAPQFQDAIGTLQQGIGDEALQRRLDTTGEALNRQLAARGLLNSGAAIEGQSALAQDVVDQFEQQRLANAGALGNLALQGSASDLGASTAGAQIGAGALGQFGGQQANLSVQQGLAQSGNIVDAARADQALGQTGLQAGLTGAGQIADIGLAGSQAQADALLNDARTQAGIVGSTQGAIADAEMAAAGATAGDAMSAGRGLSDIATGAGRAQADAQIQRANSITDALSGVAGSANQYFQDQRQDANLQSILSRLQPQQPSVLPGAARTVGRFIPGGGLIGGLSGGLLSAFGR